MSRIRRWLFPAVGLVLVLWLGTIVAGWLPGGHVLFALALVLVAADLIAASMR